MYVRLNSLWVSYLTGLVEVIVALLLLLSVVLSLVGGVTLLVVGVVTPLHLLVLDLLHLLHLLHTPLPGSLHPGQADLHLLPPLGGVDPEVGDHQGGPGHGRGLAQTVVGAAVETERESQERRERGETDQQRPCPGQSTSWTPTDQQVFTAPGQWWDSRDGAGQPAGLTPTEYPVGARASA